MCVVKSGTKSGICTPVGPVIKMVPPTRGGSCLVGGRNSELYDLNIKYWSDDRSKLPQCGTGGCMKEDGVSADPGCCQKCNVNSPDKLFNGHGGTAVHSYATCFFPGYRFLGQQSRDKSGQRGTCMENGYCGHTCCIKENKQGQPIWKKIIIPSNLFKINVVIPAQLLNRIDRNYLSLSFDS